MKDIVILNHDPLIQRIKDGFCIDYLINNGFNVKYLDLSNFYFPELKASYQLSENYVIKLKNEKDIISFLKRLDLHNTLIISEAFPSWKSRRIYKFLSDNKATVVRISIYANSILRKLSLIDKFKIKGLRDLIQIFIFKGYKFINNIKLWDYTLTSSFDMGNKRNFPINHPDYETYLDSINEVNLKDDYIVFLDEAFPVHPEIRYWLGMDLNNLIEPYRKSMTQLFDYLEEKFNKEVIICAHPKANYNGNEFGHHKIVFGETAKYVRQSAFVLMHCSSSVSFAILNNKPIIILSFKDYNRLKESKLYQITLGDILGLEIYDIEKWKPNKEEIHLLDKGKREKYIYDYMTSKGIENMHNSQIILQFLNNL